ncbi:MAG: thioredoxin family protein [Leeuwenhoekiella sp.]|nr:MAG: thioredoxin family protein [Leeuwenhoekiella sp.]
MQITTLERQDLVTQSFKAGMTYADYRVLAGSHAQSFTSTGHTQTEALSNYTLLNDRRMKRWEKTFKLTEAEQDLINGFDRPLNWLLLTESWCGDTPPATAVMQKIAEIQPNIDFRVVLRDDHPQLMDAFLSNGAKAIPKLIIQDPQTKEVLASWGSRSSAAKKLVEDFKAEHGEITSEFRESLQVWYNKDKNQAILSELIEILRVLNLETRM